MKQTKQVYRMNSAIFETNKNSIPAGHNVVTNRITKPFKKDSDTGKML